MKVFPTTSVKSLADCEVGHFVRSVEYQEFERLGLVTDFHDGQSVRRALVLLHDTIPTFQIEDEPEKLQVMAYAGEAVMDLEPSSSSESSLGNLFHQSGPVVVDQDGYFLNVCGHYGHGHGRPQTTVQYALHNGLSYPYKERMRRSAVFSEWSLFLEEDGRPFETRTLMKTFKLQQGEAPG